MMNDYSFLKIQRVWQNTADIIPRVARSLAGTLMLANFAFRFRGVYFAEISIQWQICVNYFTTFHQNISPDKAIFHQNISQDVRCHQITSPDFCEISRDSPVVGAVSSPCVSPPSHVCACPPPSDDCHQLRRSHWPPPVQCNTGHCYIHVCRLYQLQQCTTLVPLLHLWCANAPYVPVLYWLHSCNWYSLHTYMYVRRLCRLHQLQHNCNTLVPLVTVTSMMCPCISCTCVTTMFQNPSTSCTTLFWKNEKEEEWWRPGFGQRCQRG